MAVKEGRADNHDARLIMRSALWDVPVKCSGVWKGQCLQGWIFFFFFFNFILFLNFT